MRSPTALTLKFVKKRGCIARVTERWIAAAKKRQDIFGGDIQVIAGKDLINIQATSGAHHSTRLKKSLGNPEVKAWIATGNLFQVWSWHKRAYINPKTKRKTKVLRWKPRVTQIELLDGELITKPFSVNI